MDDRQLLAIMASILHATTYNPADGYIEKEESSISTAKILLELANEWWNAHETRVPRNTKLGAEIAEAIGEGRTPPVVQSRQATPPGGKSPLAEWLTERNAIWTGAGILGDTEIAEYLIGDRHVIVALYNAGEQTEAWEIYVQSSTTRDSRTALEEADSALHPSAAHERSRQHREKAAETTPPGGTAPSSEKK